MPSRYERRAAALEAIAHALLELAALEREPVESISPKELLIDHRNCEAELGLARRAFTAAAARGDFPAFRVSKRQTATKEDVLSWLKSRKVEAKRAQAIEPAKKDEDPYAFLKQVHASFVARVGRPMTDQDLSNADTCIDVGRMFAKMTDREYKETPDEVAARVVEKSGQEPVYYKDWREFGLDPVRMECDSEDLRERLHLDHPEWTWRERQEAIAVSGASSSDVPGSRPNSTRSANARRSNASSISSRSICASYSKFRRLVADRAGGGERGEVPMVPKRCEPRVA